MEEHEPLLVAWLNEHLGMMIPTHVVMQTVVVLAIIALFIFLRTRLSVEAPGKLQQAFEVFVEFLNDQLEANIGHDGHKYLNIIGTFAIFIIFANLLGLVPGFISPTSNVNVPAGCAIVVFLYYQYQGMRKHGVLKYLKHFMGPVALLAPLMIPIEVIGHLARPATLTIRLFANIMAE